MEKRELLMIKIGLILVVTLISLIGFVSGQVHTLEIGEIVNDTIIQIIPLNSGWNLISLGIVPENKSIDYIIRDIKNQVIIIKGFDNGAKTYDPNVPSWVTQSLKEMDEKHGYWIKMNSSANLIVTGTGISNKTINLNNNWNLIGYLCDNEKNVTEVFSEVMNKVIIIKGFDNGAKTYDPNVPSWVTQSLKILKPKFGYWVKMNQSGVLNYYCNGNIGDFMILGPESPLLISNPNVVWQVSANAVSYDLVISNNSNCENPIQHYESITGTYYQLSNLSDGTYYVCMYAKDIFGNRKAASNNGFGFEIRYAPPMVHRIFVTSFTTFIDASIFVPPYHPWFGGLDAADWTCSYAASQGGYLNYLGGWNGQDLVYKAILSTDDLNAANRIVIRGAIYNTHGDLVAYNASDFWDGNLVNPIGYTEFVAGVPNYTRVWSGTNAYGNWSGNSCGDWETLDAQASLGDPNAKNSTWIDNNEIIGCNYDDTASLYCISP